MAVVQEKDKRTREGRYGLPYKLAAITAAVGIPFFAYLGLDNNQTTQGKTGPVESGVFGDCDPDFLYSLITEIYLTADGTKVVQPEDIPLPMEGNRMVSNAQTLIIDGEAYPPGGILCVDVPGFDVGLE